MRDIISKLRSRQNTRYLVLSAGLVLAAHFCWLNSSSGKTRAEANPWKMDYAWSAYVRDMNGNEAGDRELQKARGNHARARADASKKDFWKQLATLGGLCATLGVWCWFYRGCGELTA